MFPKPKRPVGITLLAIMFLWIGGFGALIFPIFIVTGATKQLVELWLSAAKHSNGIIVAVATLISVLWWSGYVLYASIGYGLWQLRRWAWKGMVILHWIGVAIFIGQAIFFGFIFSSVVIGIGTGVFCLGFTGGILWYLYRPAVRWPFEATYAASKGLPILPAPAASITALWIKIACGIGTVVIIFGTFTFCLMYSIEKMFRSSDVYQIALADANASPCVVAKLGKPVIGKGSIEGNLQDGQDGSADLEIPLHGPHGDGKITLVGEKHSGAWQFTTLVVDPHDGAPIQLLPKPTPCEQP